MTTIMSDKYAETKQILSNMAAVKMDMNSHKGEIEAVPFAKLIKLLKDEIDELDSAIRNDKSIIEVIEEASDVMNYLVAVVSQQIHKYRNRKCK